MVHPVVDGHGGSSISRWRKDYQKESADRADLCVEAAPAATPTPLNAPGPTGYEPRIINTTDLGADPDEQSMVRQLVCANEFDIEGLIVATGCWKKLQSNTAMLDKILNTYGEVVEQASDV